MYDLHSSYPARKVSIVNKIGSDITELLKALHLKILFCQPG